MTTNQIPIALGRETNEVRIGKAAAPNQKRKPWRWDVCHYRLFGDGQRQHLFADFGYARTHFGAIIQIARHLGPIGVTA